VRVSNCCLECGSTECRHRASGLFFAVQMERDANAAFSERLDSSVPLLKRFASVLDIAALITQYFSIPPEQVAVSPQLWRSTQLASLVDQQVSSACEAHLAVAKKEFLTCPSNLSFPRSSTECMQAIRAMVKDDAVHTALDGWSIYRGNSAAPLLDPHRTDRLALSKPARSENGPSRQLESGLHKYLTPVMSTVPD